MIIFVYWHCVSLNSSARSRSSLKLKLSLPPRPLFSCIFSIYLPKSWRRSLGISACFAASLTCFLSILFAPFLVSLVFESFLINFFIICLIIGFSPVHNSGNSCSVDWFLYQSITQGIWDCIQTIGHFHRRRKNIGYSTGHFC